MGGVFSEGEEVRRIDVVIAGDERTDGEPHSERRMSLGCGAAC